MFEDYICAVCANSLKDPRTMHISCTDPPSAIITCAEHSDLMFSCFTCANRYACAFDSYTGPLDKIITRTIQQGNMTIMQGQMRNPEVEKVTCHFCSCWHEYHCPKLEQTYKCSNYQTMEQYLIKEEPKDDNIAEAVGESSQGETS